MLSRGRICNWRDCWGQQVLYQLEEEKEEEELGVKGMSGFIPCKVVSSELSLHHLADPTAQSPSPFYSYFKLCSEMFV